MGIDEQATSQPPGAMRGAIVGTVALVTVFAAASAPIPLYATWQQQLGLSASDVSMTIVMYLFGVLSVLFFAGSLSDASGRRPTVGAALACGVAGCLLFIGLSSGPMLQFARFVQGVSCALSMSATSAFVIDCTSERHRTFGMTIASTGYLIGLTVGSLGIGFFATVSTAYWQVFAVMAVIMLATMLALPFTPETVHNRITWKKAVKPMTHVPAHLRKLLPIVAGGYISTWSVGFFFQSLSTPASVDYLGQPIRSSVPRACLGHGPERARRPCFSTHGHAILNDRRLHHHVRRDRGSRGMHGFGAFGPLSGARGGVRGHYGHDPILEPAYAHQRIDAAGECQRGDARQLDRLRRVDRGLDHPNGSHRHIRPGNGIRFHRASCCHLNRAGMHIDGQTSTITGSEQPVASGAQTP